VVPPLVTIIPNFYDNIGQNFHFFYFLFLFAVQP